MPNVLTYYGFSVINPNHLLTNKQSFFLAHDLLAFDRLSVYRLSVDLLAFDVVEDGGLFAAAGGLVLAEGDAHRRADQRADQGEPHEPEGTALHDAPPSGALGRPAFGSGMSRRYCSAISRCLPEEGATRRKRSNSSRLWGR